MLLYRSMQDLGEGGWKDSPIHFGWQVEEVSKFIKSSPSKEHVNPISHPSDSLRLTSLGVGQPQICAYLNEHTHKESIQLFSFMYEIIRGKRPPLPNGFICPFHLLVTANLKPSFFTPLTYPVGLSLSYYLEKKGPLIKKYVGTSVNREPRVSFPPALISR